ncbi:MAG: type II toxin-antitoxin system PemK/MazF family toxin [Gammaproteobacteria bacterium]|nr:type II toxin-antitoxin system PemK/MazF family toxin [Gammaproteobacteria bacterium]
MKQKILLRGEVYQVDLNPTKGSEINKVRPCVIVGVNPINRARNTVVIVPLSSSPTPRPPLVIPIKSQGTHSVAVCDQIRAIDKARINNKLGDLTIKEIELLDESLRITLGL